MKVSISNNHVALWGSASDTYEWAHRPFKRWPCSALSGHRFMATFDRNGLYDLTIDGRHGGGPEVMANELSAICADLLREKLPVVNVKDEYGDWVTVLALSGGGMDLSWDICEAYMLRGGGR